MENEARSFINVWLTAIFCLCYCFFVTSNLPKGKPRLLSVVPVLAVFAALPLRLSTVLPTGITGFFLTWLANSKLLLLALDSGPLLPKMPLPLFIILACLPVKLRPENRRLAPCRNPRFPLNWAAKILLFSALIAVHGYTDDTVGPKTLMALHSCTLYLFIDVVLGFFINLVRVLAGVELEPPSDEPYLATSLQDFWGRRWNLVVTDILRQTVYNPLRRAAEPVLGVRWSLPPAVLAAFLVSGLMHELLYYYITRAGPTWEVTWFFVFHGICVVIEVRVKAAVKDRWRLHRAVSGPMAVAFVGVTGMWWFYPPLVRSGSDLRAIEECKAFAQFFVPSKLAKTTIIL